MAFTQNPSTVPKAKWSLPRWGTHPAGCTLDLCETSCSTWCTVDLGLASWWRPTGGHGVAGRGIDWEIGNRVPRLVLQGTQLSELSVPSV